MRMLSFLFGFEICSDGECMHVCVRLLLADCLLLMRHRTDADANDTHVLSFVAVKLYNSAFPSSQAISFHFIPLQCHSNATVYIDMLTDSRHWRYANAICNNGIHHIIASHNNNRRRCRHRHHRHR